MTILRGHFAMVLAGRGRRDRRRGRGRAAHRWRRTGRCRCRSARCPRSAGRRRSAATYLLSVHGADRPGIVSAVTAVVATAGGNVTDLSTRLTGDLYVLLAEVDLPAAVDPEQLDRDLVATGIELGVEVSMRVLDPDVL